MVFVWFGRTAFSEDLRAFDGGGDEPFYVHALLGAFHGFEGGMDDGRFGQEHRAAVLVGADGDVESARVLGDRGDLVLVQTHQRTEYGQGRGRARAGHALNRLRSHLSQALAGDERAALVLFREAAGYPHHEPAHYGDHEVRGAMLVYGELDIREHGAELGGERQVQHARLHHVVVATHFVCTHHGVHALGRGSHGAHHIIAELIARLVDTGRIDEYYL